MEKVQHTRYPIKVERDIGYDVAVPGFGYADLDRYDCVPLDTVARWIEGIMSYITFPHLMPEPDPSVDMWYLRMCKANFTFMVGASYEFLPAFYDHGHYHNSILGLMRFVNLGQKSYQNYHEGWSTKTKQLLFKSAISLVLADKQTRRAVPLPDEMILRFKGKETDLSNSLTKKVQKLNKEKLAEKPGYVITRKVCWSDVDRQFHVNQSYLIKYCMDAVTEAGSAGFLSKVNVEIGKRFFVSGLKCSYSAELNAADHFEAHVWEDANDPLTVYAILQKDDRDIFHATFSFKTSESFLETVASRI